jgi:hypothetical protein
MHLTGRDRELLQFIAEHRIVLLGHVRGLLGVSAAAAYARLRTLTNGGLVRREPGHIRGGACYLITGRGLAVVGSDLPRARVDWRCYEHDVGVAWLWLRARSGAFGPLREVVSERRMRSHDAGEEGREAPLAVRLGGVGPGGRERLHYPDLLVVDARGRRVALELELSSKSRTRREAILAGYGADPRIDAVVYLVADRSGIGRAIQTSARRLGLSDRIHVQQIRLEAPGAAPAPERTRAAGRALTPAAGR